MGGRAAQPPASPRSSVTNTLRRLGHDASGRTVVGLEPGRDEADELAADSIGVARIAEAAGVALDHGPERDRERQGADHEVKAPVELSPVDVGQQAREGCREAVHHRGELFEHQGLQLGARLRERHAEKSGDRGSVLMRSDPLDSGLHEGRDDVLETHVVHGLAGGQPPQALGVQRPEATFENRLGQFQLRAEVVVDRGHVRARLLGDGAHRGEGEAALGKEAFRRVEEAVASGCVGAAHVKHSFESSVCFIAIADRKSSCLHRRSSLVSLSLYDDYGKAHGKAHRSGMSSRLSRAPLCRSGRHRDP